MSPGPEKRVRATWARLCAFEIDHVRVGIVWVAHDVVTDTAYVYDTAIRPKTDLAVLAALFRDRGKWIPVLFDHKRGDEEDGLKVAERLADLKVEIFTATVSPEAAATEMAIRLAASRLKVFSHCEDWFGEYRRYRRDEKGEIVTDDCRLIGATGLALAHLSIGISENRASSDAEGYDASAEDRRGRLTGY